MDEHRKLPNIMDKLAPLPPLSPLAPTLPEPHSPMEPDLLRLALSNGANVETIERLVALRERMEALAAERSFNGAMSRVQAALSPIATDMTNPQKGNKYASYAAIDRVIRPVYCHEGLALSFDTDISPLAEHVRVLCYVTHRDGHTRTYKCDMPADGKGAKGGDVMSKTHASAAAQSYGMRYLVRLIFNLAIGEEDTDGNTTMGELAEHLDRMEAARDLAELKRQYDKAYAKAKAEGDRDAIKALVEAKDKRKAALEAPKAATPITPVDFA